MPISAATFSAPGEKPGGCFILRLYAKERVSGNLLKDIAQKKGDI